MHREMKFHRPTSNSWATNQCVRVSFGVILVTCLCYLLVTLLRMDLGHPDQQQKSLHEINASLHSHTLATAASSTGELKELLEQFQVAPEPPPLPLPTKEPFVPQPLPYSPSSPPCTTYAQKHNCESYPQLRADPLPSCGGISSSSPNLFPFLIIGDWAHGGHCQDSVAALSQKIEAQFGRAHFIWGLGDTAYWDATCQDLQYAFQPGQYFSTWLDQSPEGVSARAQCRTPQFQGDHVPKLNRDAPSTARYYPVMGNHDWDHWYRNSIDFDSMPYYQYFPHLRSKFIDFHPSSSAFKHLFLNGQTVKDSQGLAHVSPGILMVSLNSNPRPSHIRPGDARSHAIYEQQLQWLKQTVDTFPRKTSASSPFNLMAFHHPPFASAQHDAPAVWMDLEYEEMGFDAVFFGHQHAYERLLRNAENKPSGNHPTIPYFLNGLGGHPWVYTIDSCPAYPGSKIRYNKFHGIQLGLYHFDQLDSTWKIELCLYTLEGGGSVKDHVTLKR